jgi:phage terminase large subunit
MKTNRKIKRLSQSKARYKVAYGGRGSGKSYGVAQMFVALALTERARFLCTKETQNTLSDSALAIMKRVISDYGLDAYFEQTKHGLACTLSGSEFIFRGLQHPERIKSLDGIKYCWVEEAQSVTKEAWDMLIPTIREPGSEIWVTFNPDQETDPAYQMFVKNTRDDVAVEKIDYHDNRYFPAVLRVELEYDKRIDYEKYLWIWEGNTRTISDAQVFRGKFRVASFETPEDARFYYGADWGFHPDPSTLIRCFIRNGILWIDHEFYGVGVDIDDLPERWRMVPGADKWPIWADSQRPDTIAYMRKQGFNVRGADKGPGSVEDGIAFMRSFRGIVIHERCKHVADEFKLYKHKQDKLTGEVLPALEDKNNHCIDAIRYALEKLCQATGGSVSRIPASEMGL